MVMGGGLSGPLLKSTTIINPKVGLLHLSKLTPLFDVISQSLQFHKASQFVIFNNC